MTGRRSFGSPSWMRLAGHWAVATTTINGMFGGQLRYGYHDNDWDVGSFIKLTGKWQMNERLELPMFQLP